MGHREQMLIKGRRQESRGGRVIEGGMWRNWLGNVDYVREGDTWEE